MANTLDSRFLRLGNCFAHRFSAPGTFRYMLTGLPSSYAAHLEAESGLAVTVNPSSGAPQTTHYVAVSACDALSAVPDRVTITAGDLVVWSPDKSVIFGFRVRGRIGPQVVDSGSMDTESVFTHAFGLPGRYRWRDANGSSLRGEVRVAAAGEDHEAWLEHLKDGTLVHVRGQRAEPESVEVLVGQTVAWAVEDAPGVTVTDEALLTRGGPGD